MMYTVIPLEMVQGVDPASPTPTTTRINGVRVTQSNGVIQDVLSTDPMDYLKLPRLGRLE
ncbi:MAG: YlzJ-like family protein [Eubacteriales bacterium]|nr:YlzJ-like family protein [Eubacteriales bacterium]